MFDPNGPNRIDPRPFFLGLGTILLWLIGAAVAMAQAPSCSQVPNGSGGVRIFNCQIQSEVETTSNYSVCVQRSAEAVRDGEELEIELGSGLQLTHTPTNTNYSSCLNSQILTLVWKTNPNSMQPCEIPIGSGPVPLFRFEAEVSGPTLASAVARRTAATTPFGCHEDHDLVGTSTIFTGDSNLHPNPCTSGESLAPNLCRDDRSTIFADGFESKDTSAWDVTVGGPEPDAPRPER